MKKIIAMCSVLVIVSLLIVCFASCSGNNDNETTTSSDTTGNVVSDVLYSAEVGESSAVIKSGDEVFQTLSYPNNPNIVFDYAYAKEHFEFIDMNFDGQPDFYIAVSKQGSDIYYYCWLYNATTNKFDYSISLSALKNISVDSLHQQIISTVYSDEGEKAICYRWVDGVLKYTEDYDSANDTIPEEITQVVQQNSIGSDKKPAQSTQANKPATTVKNEKPTKENATNTTTAATTKPSAITTTSPASGGVVLNTNADIDDGWY